MSKNVPCKINQRKCNNFLSALFSISRWFINLIMITRWDMYSYFIFFILCRATRCAAQNNHPRQICVGDVPIKIIQIINDAFV